MTLRLSAALVLLLSFVAPLRGQTDEGDRLWLLRAEGALESRAAEEPADAVINAYGTALHDHPESLETRWKLMRALRFKGAYVAQDVEQKRVIFDRARQVGEAGLAQLDRALAAKEAGSVMKGKEAIVATTLRTIPHAGEFLYWDAVAWGEWAQAFGKIPAVRQGAADRILRETTLAMMIDPAIEDGGGARVLGRLHHQTPRIPFITGWASDAKAVQHLRASLELGPENKLTRIFLAEALASHRKADRPEAVALLRSVVQDPVDPAFAVEDAEAQEQAQALLAKWGE
ncbi:MAG: TRAP transporter TatT component family protein [Thermoanaerobaculia bacterium]